MNNKIPNFIISFFFFKRQSKAFIFFSPIILSVTISVKITSGHCFTKNKFKIREIYDHHACERRFDRFSDADRLEPRERTVR